MLRVGRRKLRLYDGRHDRIRPMRNVVEWKGVIAPAKRSRCRLERIVSARLLLGCN
jgi:hypothetical protein